MTPKEASALFRTKIAQASPDQLDFLIDRAADENQDMKTRTDISMKLISLEAAFQMREGEAPPAPPSVNIVFDDVKPKSE